jgi:hypothetical protein
VGIDVYILGAIVAGVFALTLVWVFEIGTLRALLAGLCRLGWLAPLLLAVFPRITTQKLPSAIAVHPLHVFIDDSESMQRPATKAGVTPAMMAEETLQGLEKECSRLACSLKITKLSQLSSATADGYSYLNEAFEVWLQKLGNEPWMIISDGGDSQPSLPWSEKLRDLAKPAEGSRDERGIILGVNALDERNTWIAAIDAPPFSFQDKPVELQATIKRSPFQISKPERIQLQVLLKDKTLSSINVDFLADVSETIVSVVIPPLARGQNLITLKVLPTGGEKTLWDNTAHAQIEVLANTVGMLHLLGAPSWDGRFLRRYLKSEPKYDLISFFILRDPWDSQQVSERELSLIPFPVDRLFNEELPNFRVVVIQNFALFQFLQPEYQKNLVNFVKGGGGLLFIGGPRALTSGDLTSSALSEIIPFEKPEGLPSSRFAMPLGDGDEFKNDKIGPYYDADLKFKIEMATPTEDRRALANIFDDWQEFSGELSQLENAQGLHHMEQVKFKPGEYTALLNAKTSTGAKIPLAVASYPGKGRALWLFSDSLWRLAMAPTSKIARQNYNGFLTASMNWLLRQEIRKPVVVKNLRLREETSRQLRWQVDVMGPAAKYFNPSEQWELKLCGMPLKPADYSSDKVASDFWQFTGTFPTKSIPQNDKRCTFEIKGVHSAFGSVAAQITEVIPQTYADKDMDPSPSKLEDLAKLSKAELVFLAKDSFPKVREWLESMSQNQGIATPSRFKSMQNHFWVLDTWWVWLLVLLLPVEVLIRRWHLLGF